MPAIFKKYLNIRFEGGEEFFFADAGFGGKKYEKFFIGFLFAICFKKYPFLIVKFGFREFVYLRNGNYIRNFVMIHPLGKAPVKIGWFSAGINYQNHKLEILRIHKICFDRFAPVVLHRYRDFCVSITRQVHKIKFLVYQKIINHLSSPGRRAGLRHALSIDQFVYQR